MSKRADIKDGISSAGQKSGLIYTKILGWIDLGHACGEDARRLKEILLEERGARFFPKFNAWYFPVDYYQDFGKMIKFNTYQAGGYVGINTPLMIRTCLSWEVKTRIALTIMMKTAYRFEALQQSTAFSWYTDSGFSGEDLVSDLVGFYRIFGNGIDPIVLSCPTTKEYALGIWDHYGEVGNYKKKDFRPLLFPQPVPPKRGIPRKGFLPSWLNYIKPLDNLSESFIYNRFENEPSRNLFSDPDRINHEIYLSMRRKGWDELDGVKNNATPAMLNIMQHHPVSVDYFELRD
ncbi:hypothetical protein EDF78_11231 [Rahnella sp. BIGb0236]|uniref:hypothetical protein n=1 Tax=Rahnella sp. BIGb0236 TaxID=2485117 RepID=UPI0010DD906A|nr:hypothetical protein [Rahnella sp. BIGb0236]TDS88023.1 hypothetical protein EDF78_11231 [Rahnella sp. BIGb0236]VTQ53389.1 Uncharacterised protein [Campylobacter jejuni]